MLEWIAISFSRDLPDPGIEPGSPALQADALQSEPPGEQGGAQPILFKFFCCPIVSAWPSRHSGHTSAFSSPCELPPQGAF